MNKQSTSFTIGEHFQRFTREQVASGRFGSTSEVIRAGLRLLEAEEQKLEALRAAIQEGLDSGVARPFDFDAFMERKFGPERDV